MAAAPVGLPVWATGVWADTVWESGVWASAAAASGGEGVLNAFFLELMEMSYQPFNQVFAVTKHDTTNLEPYTASGKLTSALHCGGAGVVAAVFGDDKVVNITVVAGQTLPIAIKRVNSTNTTATVMTALYAV